MEAPKKKKSLNEYSNYERERNRQKQGIEK